MAKGLTVFKEYLDDDPIFNYDSNEERLQCLRNSEEPFKRATNKSKYFLWRSQASQPHCHRVSSHPYLTLHGQAQHARWHYFIWGINPTRQLSNDFHQMATRLACPPVQGAPSMPCPVAIKKSRGSPVREGRRIEISKRDLVEEVLDAFPADLYGQHEQLRRLSKPWTGQETVSYQVA